MKQKKLAWLLVLCLALPLFAACGQAYDDGGYSYAAKEEYEDINYAADYEAPAAYEESTSYGGDGLDATSDKASAAKSRKIIYSSDYDIQTKDYDASVSVLKGLVDKYGAYFESSNTYGNAQSGGRRSSYTVRVPVQNYAAFIGETGSIGVVTSSSENNTDVTEQYFDIEARLSSAQLREERVLEILKQASKLDDVLALERELADIRYEIESYTGTLRKYDSLINYSTVTLSLTEVNTVVIPTEKVLTFGERVDLSFKEGVENFTDGFEDFVVFLSYHLIGLAIWLVIIVIIVLIVVGATRRSRKKELKRREELAKLQQQYAASQAANAGGAQPKA